jgi:membrane protease YdiL (CAAX protease family)
MPRASTPGTADARRVVVGATLVFAVALIGGGLVILWARKLAIFSVFNPVDLTLRGFIGAGIGALTAGICALVVARLPGFANLRRLAEHAVEGIEPRWHTMLVVALAAGVSEEFFFRGVLEPVIGP